MIGVVILVVNTHCKKDPAFAKATGVVVPPPPTVNTAPKSNAGSDQLVVHPASTCLLVGSAYDKESNIQQILWTKISGPASYLIENPNSFRTSVINLEQGVYQFECTVTDKMGLYGKDTLKVTVREISSTTDEIILENQTWIFPWYNTIQVSNFSLMVPASIPFRIYIQRDANPAWLEVDPIAHTVIAGPYEYFLETLPNNSGLNIFYYGNDVSDTPAVKITF